MSTIKKQANARRTKERRVNAVRHQVNRAEARHRAERVTTSAGLFVALIKERGFVRDGTFTKRMDNGDVHEIVMDYIPGKAALLVINPVTGGDTIGECAHVLYYDEQPLPTKTREYLERKAKPKQRSVHYKKEKPARAMAAAFQKAISTTGE
jgi:hypothetical protein